MDRRFHFVGIGGAGMAPLAELLLDRGAKISGSDSEYNAKCAELAARGAKIFTGHRAENLPDDAELLVYSSAVPPENPERKRAAERGLCQVRRGEFLAEFASGYRRVVAVSGSHGKSSITALTASILVECGFHPGFMIGAAVAGMPSFANGRGDDVFVTEADESDGTHALLKNFLAVVPNVEDDHAWSLGGVEALERNFRKLAQNSAHLLYYASPECDRLFSGHPDAIRLENVPERFGELVGFQAANANLAFHAALLLGCPESAARDAACRYPAVARRMTVRLDIPELVIVEDYAHHPTEVRRSIELLRLRYPGRHLRVLIQPHRYARLERYFNDFARELSRADSVRVAPVFAAWCETGGVSGEDLARAVKGESCSGSWEEIARQAIREMPVPAVLAVLGAGDIEEVFPYLTAR